MSAPLIVCAMMGAEDFAWADALRMAYFPPERNVLRAHLTLFHHIAPSLEEELCRRLKAAARQAPPKASLASVLNLGRGVAYRIESPELLDVRERLAEAFWDTLIPQDRAPWRPHITIQNKMKPEVARTLLARLSADFAPRSFEITGLGIYRYLGGPWAPVAGWRFGLGHRMLLP